MEPRGRIDTAAGAWDDGDLVLIEQRARDRRQYPWLGPISAAPTVAVSVPAPASQEATDAISAEVDVPIATRINIKASGQRGELFDVESPRGSFPTLYETTSPRDATDGDEAEDDGVALDDIGLDIDEIDLGDGACFDEAAERAGVSDAVLEDSAYEWDIVPESDEIEPPLFEIDCGGAALDRYGKAERLAYETILRTGLDKEVAYPVLLDIFYESPWARTRTSIEELVGAGAVAETLALAAKIRRAWRNHPEFAQPAPSFGVSGGRWYQNPVALENLNWAEAAALAELWTSYPDIEEVERLLERLSDEWECRRRLRRQFLNFRLFVTHLATEITEPIDDWLEQFFDAGDDRHDPIERLEEPDRWPSVRVELREYGIDLS